MATQEQLNSVRMLQEIDDRTLGGYNQVEGQYNLLADKDPYEAYHAKMAGGLLVFSVDSVTVTGSSIITMTALLGGGEQYYATVNFNAPNTEDDTVTWDLENVNAVGSYDISADGLVTQLVKPTGGDTFDVVAYSNFDSGVSSRVSIEIVIV